VITQFTERIRMAGPSPLSKTDQCEKTRDNLEAAIDAVEGFRLRVLVGRERELTEKKNVYDEKIAPDEFGALFDAAIEAEFFRHQIHVLTRNNALSVKTLAAATELQPTEVLKHVVSLRRRNMITVDHIEGNTPFYKALEVQ